MNTLKQRAQLSLESYEHAPPTAELGNSTVGSKAWVQNLARAGVCDCCVEWDKVDIC